MRKIMKMRIVIRRVIDMSIDEAIAHAREVAEKQRKDNDNCKNKSQYGCKGCADYYSKPCIECAEEHEQLAAWLEELKDYRDKNKMVVRVDVENMDSIKYKIEELSKYAESQYNKAIDDFTERLIRYVDCDHLCSPTEARWSDLSVVKMVEELAEQLKVGGENDNLRR